MADQDVVGIIYVNLRIVERVLDGDFGKVEVRLRRPGESGGGRHENARESPKTVTDTVCLLKSHFVSSVGRK